ncbi:MAG: SRPBCC domain-containing protein, partial [Pseudonocardiaceae bacterium]
MTDGDLTAVYWAHRNVSDWQQGSTWEHQRIGDTHVADIAGTIVECAGTIVECTAPTRLVLTWNNPADGTPVPTAARAQAKETLADGPSRVTFDIEPHGEIVRLTVTHENLADEAERDA